MGLSQAPATELQPGTYFIGDPCYVMSHGNDEWVDIVEACDYWQEPYSDRGKTAVAFSTAWGDGVYIDAEGNEYSVDTGLIGAVPVELWSVSLDEIETRNLGQVVTFKEPFICQAGAGGVLMFGHIVIDTDPVSDSDADFKYELEELYEES